MEHRRILVLGSPGAGKSTFALKLGAITGLPVVHMDRLYWRAGWTPPEQDEFYEKLQIELDKGKWIIDGNYHDSLPVRLPYCDLVIYLELSRVRCLWRVTRRALKYRGVTRPDLHPGCPDKIDREFASYTWNFEKAMGVPSKEMVAASGKPVVWLKSDRDKLRYLESIKMNRM